MIEESPISAKSLKIYSSKQVNRLSNGHLAKEYPQPGQQKPSEQHTDDNAGGQNSRKDEE